MGAGWTTREKHFDGEDTAKWSGEAKRQMEVLPPGSEKNFVWEIYETWVKDLKLEGTAVDFGCGTAYYRSLFKHMDYIGIDQNQDMLRSSRLRWPEGGNESFRETPLGTILDKFPELEGIADAGLFVTVLQHNHEETAAEIMSNVTRIIKPGGTLFLFEATYIDKYYPEETRKNGGFRDIDPECLESMAYGAAIFTEKGWVNFLDHHGFDVISYDGGCGYVARKR